MSLDALAPEILLKIIKYVSMIIFIRGVPPDYGAFLTEIERCRRGEHLAHLALCSRKMNTLTTPLLYEYFATAAPLPQVLHRLLGNHKPDVSITTKEILTSSLYDSEDEGRIDSASLAPMTEYNFAKCDKIVRETTLAKDDADIWSQRLRKGYWDSHMALALTLLPNLEVLNLENHHNLYDFADESRFIKQVFNRAARLQEAGKLDEKGSLSKLRSFQVAYSEDESGLYIDTILHFLKPKSVKEVFIHMLHDEEFEPRGTRFFTENLTLQKSCVEGDCLVRFMSCFRNLKRFQYENGGPIIGYHDFLPQKVGEAIMHLKPCLEILEVGDQDGHRGPYDGEGPLPLGCLAGFEKLEIIITRSEFLLGGFNFESFGGADEDRDENTERKLWNLNDVLPKSIKKLGLSHCHDKENGYLRELLPGKEKNFPFLENVRFYYQSDLEPDEKETQALQRECRLAGFNFTALAGSPAISYSENFFT